MEAGHEAFAREREEVLALGVVLQRASGRGPLYEVAAAEEYSVQLHA